LTLNPRLSRDLGTRHRAAIGVTEDTDAVAVVVSEETGVISFIQRGEIRRGLDATKLRGAIFDALEAGPKKTKEQKHSESENEAEEIAPV
jgi:diadenylate cyclase